MMKKTGYNLEGNIGGSAAMGDPARRFRRNLAASGAPASGLSVPPPPPPPPKSKNPCGRGVEAVGAPGRTARRLSAGFVALFLIVLGAAFAPQIARAQDQTPALTAAPGPGQVTLSWTMSSLGFTTQWRYRQKEGAGEYGGWQKIPGGVGIRSHTIGGLTAGVAYTFQVTGAYLTGVSRAITNYANPSNEVSATPAVVPSITLTVTRIGSGVTLSWTGANLPAVVNQWDVRYTAGSQATGNYSRVPDSTRATNTHTITNLTPGRYTFQVRTGRSDGAAGTESNQVTVFVSTVALTVTGNDEWFGFEWVYDGPTDGAVSWQLEWIRLSDRNGEGRWLDLPGGVALREYGYSATNGETGVFRVRLVGPGGRTEIASSVFNNQGWIEATPRAATPTLTSDPDKTVTVGSADATTDVCFNLLSVKQVRGNDTLIWLQQRTGGNSYINRLANLQGNNRVEITKAPAGIATGLGVGLFPCATLGVGTHTVTWSWKGRDGTAVAATTSTTITVAVRDSGPKTITLSASPSATITEGDSGSTDVTITFTLSEPAPANFSLTSGYDVDPGTATGSGKGRDPCDPPLLPVDTDLCFPNGVIVSIAEGQTQGTMTVRILGDTRDEPDETVNLIGYEDGWTSGKLTLTITDDDEAAQPAAPTGLSATAGNAQVTLSWTDPDDASITRWEYRQKAGNGSYSSWTRIAGSGATTVKHQITGLTNDTVYKFRIRAVNGNGNGAASDEVTATPATLVAPVLTAATSTRTGGFIDLTWTHASTSVGDQVANGVAFYKWEMGHRLKGSSNWALEGSPGSGSTPSRRTKGFGLGNTYPEGASVEVRIRAEATNSSGNYIYGPWSNIRTVTYKNGAPGALKALTITGAPVTVEAGASASYTVALTQAYAGTLSITSSATAKATVDPATLTFSTTNYSTGQMVTVTGVEAGTAKINHVFRLTGAAADAIPDAGAVAVTVNAATTTTVPAAPTNLTATGAGTTQVLLTWTKPAGTITGYKLRYAKTPAKGSATWAAMAGSGANTVRHMVTGLEDDAEYSFMIRAVNASGDGAATGWVTATPMDSCPSVLSPTNLSLAPRSDGFVVTWTAPTDLFRNGWTLSYGKTGESSTSVTISNAAATSRTLTGLDANTEYEISLTATHSTYNPSAVCPPGFRVKATGTTAAAATPGVIVSTTSLTVEEGSSNTYTVKLSTAPSANVTVTVGGESGEVTVTGSPLTFTPGNFGTAQTITVRAAADDDRNDDTATLTHAASSTDTDYGASLEIDDVDVTVTDTTPTLQLLTNPAAVTEGTPISLTVTSDKAQTGNLTVSMVLSDRGSSGFDADDIAGTLGPRAFTVAFGNSASTTGTVTIPTSTDTDVEGAETYRITLEGGAGTYAVGDDATADGTLNDGATASVPAKPTGFTAVQGSGNEQAVLSWSDPSNASITKWEYSQDGVWKDVPGSSASTITYTVPGLSTGTAYAFKVRAVNVNGAGAASDEATVTPAWTGVPAKPSGLRAEAGVEQVTLSWDAQPNQRISRWGHQRRTSGGAWPASATFVAGTGATATRTVTGLTAGTAYEFRIQASQGSGNDGPWSDVVTATPFAAGTPRVVVTPTALTIEEGRSGTYTVKLNTAPSANVTVTVGGESGEVTVTGSPLTFTPGNYDTAQTVTVNAGTDDDSTDDTATLTHTSASSDSNYGSSLNIDEVAVTVTDTTPPSSDPADDGDGDDGESGDVEVVEKVVEVVDGDGVFFQDAGLAGVVARALGATDLARRNEPEVALLRVLNAARSGVADLAGLEIASGLKSLDLSGNRITDLTPLAALDGLTTLILSGNPGLENLAPLAGLTLLGHLDLSSNRRITDLTPLSGLALLETLRLDRTGVSDLTPLAGLVRLKTLNLSWNRQIVDLSPLSGLILLETLRLDGIGASDLAPLAGLTRLETLTLSSNRQIVDLSALSGLTMLRTLRLDHTGASDFSLLSAFTELRTLSLSGNGITDLSPLQALVKLSALHLGANQIEEVSPLADLTALRSLSLNDNRITDVTALAALPRLASLNLNGNPLVGFPSTGFRQLRGLYLRDCGVADIGALAHLAQIETLFLDGNGIGDLTPLSSLSGLTKLFLARNAISDLTPLSQLAALRQLVLDDNDISDVSALSSLSGLTKLFLTRNEVSDLTPLSRLAELEQLTLGGNDVADVSALSGLRKLELLSLGQNQVADIAALAKLPALEYLDLRDNPLDPDALSIHIPALEERGVQVLY